MGTNQLMQWSFRLNLSLDPDELQGEYAGLDLIISNWIDVSKEKFFSNESS